jgi:hypothetical protein
MIFSMAARSATTGRISLPAMKPNSSITEGFIGSASATCRLEP